MMCDKVQNTALGVESGETTPPAVAKPLPAPSKETDDDLPEVIPDVPNAPII
jgi:hypothetical protein